MTITTISPRELELEREVTRLEYELTLSEFNSRVYFDGATTIQQHLKDEIKALKAKLAKYEKREPVAWLDPWTGTNATTDYDAYGRHGIPLYTKGTTNV